MRDSTPDATRNTPPGDVSPPAVAPSENGPEQTQPAGDTLYCVNHPTVETLLRCNRCGRPICLKCAELTDVGYRCKECIRGVQDKYFNASTQDNIVAFGVALVVAAIAAPLVGILLGAFRFFGWIIAFMVGGAAGGLLAQIVRTAVQKRRGRYLRYYAMAGVIAGVILGNIATAIVLGGFVLNLALLIFTVLAVVTANQLLR